MGPGHGGLTRQTQTNKQLSKTGNWRLLELAESGTIHWCWILTGTQNTRIIEQWELEPGVEEKPLAALLSSGNQQQGQLVSREPGSVV